MRVGLGMGILFNPETLICRSRVGGNPSLENMDSCLRKNDNFRVLFNPHSLGVRRVSSQIFGVKEVELFEIRQIRAVDSKKFNFSPDF